jgi:AGZA family xanthine/uracil permease-like MFS transporter
VAEVWLNRTGWRIYGNRNKEENHSFALRLSAFLSLNSARQLGKRNYWVGLPRFLALIYMINVESSFTGISRCQFRWITRDIFLVTCLVLGVGSIAVGFCSNTPTLATPAMGLNAMFAFNIASTFADKSVGITVAMLATMLSSVLLVIICYTKLLTFILKSIPQSLSIGITVAFGFFIMYVGLNSMG